MGRELRRVPPNWDHPRDEYGKYIPMTDQEYDPQKWIDEFIACGGWHQEESGRVPFWEHSPPPSYKGMRPKYQAEPTWYQVYENVSEGTPATAPFATQDELIDYLVDVGEFAGTQWVKRWSRAAAEKFVREDGWAPSGAYLPGLGWVSGYEAAVYEPGRGAK